MTMRKGQIYFCLLLLLLVVADGLRPCAADAWWNEQWQHRRRISLDTTANGANIGESLSDVPILIRLHTGNFEFNKAKGGGEDIRFVAGDDTTLLKHHIEKIDPLEEIATVWVRVPRLPGNSSQEFIWLYYGNENAVGSAETGGTFDLNQAAVFHFGEAQGLPRDATANRNDAAEFTGGQGFPAVIGNGIVLNGIGDRMRIPAAPSISVKNGFTFSAWLRMANPQGDAHLFSAGDPSGRVVVGIREFQPYVLIGAEGGPPTALENITAQLTPNTWHQLTFAAAPMGDAIVYLDGVEAGRAALAAELPKLEGDLFVGASAAGDANHYAGEMDELQLATLPRSPGWIRAALSSQSAESALYRVGPETASEGAELPVFYLVTIMKNITLDGWIIIGILIFLMIASWIIIINKSIFTWLIDRENKRFVTEYRTNGNPIGFEADEGRFANASLYKIYQAGRRSLQPLTGGEPGKTVPARAKDVFRAALDRGYIEESQRINAWLVVLTFAITGGPFLGLLGTVWGVMNTFAAMAEAGEANIMAIAPGVASALSTTVFGLIVAIPALFGYNFINSKIKSITLDMNVFIDEYTLNVDQAFMQ